jgi:hypothetical protein
MPVAAGQDFRNVMIYSPDALEMLLILSIAAALREAVK